jgi:predicted metal-dependent hydrolase
MGTMLQLGDIAVEVVRKDIKNVHLSVHPPSGRVRIAAPSHLSGEAIRAFAVGKLGWIRRQQQQLREQEREPPREYLSRETHYVWGNRCLLAIVEQDAPPAVDWEPRRLTLFVRPNTGPERRAELLEAWFRQQVRGVAEPMAATWQARLGVQAERLFVRHMRTRWGSCNPSRRTLRLNTELGRKPLPCLEYILVHELVHLLESTHNPRFVAIMDQHLPDWRHRRDLLNRQPIRHEDWRY